MNSEEPDENKNKTIDDSKHLLDEIKRLERKKELLENDFKDHIHSVLENAKPVNILKHALNQVNESSPLKHNLLKKTFLLGEGFFSKNEIISKFKGLIKKTLRSSLVAQDSPLSKTTVIESNDMDVNKDKNMDTENNKNNIMNQTTEKVKAKPEVLPEPTYWPFFLAMGLAFLGWGLLTTWLISLAGFIILVIALTGWINILRHE